MKIICRLIMPLIFAATFCGNIAAQENETYVIHTIEKGQSLYSISNMYGTTIEDIVRLNPGSDRTIVEGRTLKIPRNATSSQRGTFHTIKGGETLYRLTVLYNVSAKDICDANPGLSANNFRVGQVIIIPSPREDTNAAMPAAAQTATTSKAQVLPKCKDMHKVQKKETVYSISRMYGLTEDELVAANPELSDLKKLKKGKFICIPYPKAQQQAETNKRIPTDAELFSQSKKEKKSIRTIKAAVILPFMSSQQQSSERERMVEYYQGFLMAVDSLKRTGTSIDLYTFDSGTDEASIKHIINSNGDLKNMDVIFGPLHTNQIKPLADFATANGVRLVIPFTSRDNSVYRNPSIYQINTPQSYIYSEVYDHFTRQFRNSNVIFIDASKEAEEKADFINGMKQHLRDKNIAMSTISENATSEEFKAKLKHGTPNIFIPTSGATDVLIKALPQLSIIVKDTLNTDDIRLFGYPEWQTYTKEFLNDFFELDTYFYTSFYTNNLFAAPKAFARKYRRWYGKDMADRFPKYGMLGFDTGYFFLNGLARYGSAFEDNVSSIYLNPIQTGFKFQRVNNWGGFINKKVFFIRFSKDYELIKLDFDQQ